MSAALYICLGSITFSVFYISLKIADIAGSLKTIAKAQVATKRTLESVTVGAGIKVEA